MALGTLMGGSRIVRPMGLRITKLTPMQGFCAETGGAIDAVHGDLSRGSNVDHPHHHRRHRWRPRRAADVGGCSGTWRARSSTPG